MTAATCINLSAMFGDRYRIAFDEADDRARRVIEDPWLYEMRCQRGTIYPHGGTTLAVTVDRRPITARKIASMPGCRVIQDGDVEKTFVFNVADFDKVAAIVLPYRKRQVSEAERQRLAEMGRRHGFKPHQSDAPADAPASADGKSDQSIVHAV